MRNKRDSVLFVAFVLIVGGIFISNPQIFESSPSTAYSAYPGPGENVGKEQPSPTPTNSSSEDENTPVPTAQPSKNETFTLSLDLDAEIELRKSIGFRSDIEYVEAVRSSDNIIVNKRFGGVALTPDEARELETRLNMEKDGDVLLNFFENKPEFQDVFGGIYLDHAAGSEDETSGGKLVLQLVKDHVAVNDILATLPALQYPERLQIVFVEFSSDHLKQQFREISNTASQHFEIQAVYIDQKNNQIIVVIFPSEMQMISDGKVDKTSLPVSLSTLVSDPSIVVQEGEIEENVEAVRGGDSWSDTSGGSNCTLGFKVKYGNNFSMLTAGHCIEDLGMSYGDDVYHSTTKIGTWSGPSMNGSTTSSGVGIDAAVLVMNDFGTASDDVNHYSNYSDIVGSTSNYVTGYWRCWTGKNTGTQCGVTNCTSLTYSSGGRWYKDMFTVDPSGVVGDSGAPGYRPETGSKASVTGIKRSSLNSSCTSGFDSAFSKWHNIRDFWGLTLVNDSEVYIPLIIK
jgi:hypothetical protein